MKTLLDKNYFVKKTQRMMLSLYTVKCMLLCFQLWNLWNA